MTSRRMPKSVSAPVAGHAEPASPLPVAAVLSFLKETRGMLQLEPQRPDKVARDQHG